MKLAERKGWEFTEALVKLAEPIGNLADDDDFYEAFRESTARAVTLRQKDGLRYIMRAYSKLVPMLLGDKHRMDTLRILSVVEDKPLSEIMQMPGGELIQHLRDAVNEYLSSFFISAAHGESKGSFLH